MKKLTIKTEEEMKIMLEGGKKLGEVKHKLAKAVKPGASAWDIEVLANELIEKENAYPSFKKVHHYKWATCINVNDGVVHGIPKKEVVFKKGDIISVDVGIFYKGFHTDTALTVYLGSDKEQQKFVSAGKKAMLDGIKAVKKGKTIGDISKSIEKTLLAGNLRPIWNLTGHGIGKELHEEPNIPCFVSDDPIEKLVMGEGMAFAVEVMYTKGNGDIKMDKDGWTLRTIDGKIAGLWEETVALMSNGPVVLTE